MFRDPISGVVSLPGSSPRKHYVQKRRLYPTMVVCTIRTKHAIGGKAIEVMPLDQAVAKKRKLKSNLKILKPPVHNEGVGVTILEEFDRVDDAEPLRVVCSASYFDPKPALTRESVARIKQMQRDRIISAYNAPAVSEARFYAEAYAYFVENFNPADHRKVRCNCGRKKVKLRKDDKGQIKVPQAEQAQPREKGAPDPACRRCHGSGWRAPTINEVWRPRSNYTVMDQLAEADRALKRRARERKLEEKRRKRKASNGEDGRPDSRRKRNHRKRTRKVKRGVHVRKGTRYTEENNVPEYTPEPPPGVN